MGLSSGGLLSCLHSRHTLSNVYRPSKMRQKETLQKMPAAAKLVGRKILNGHDPRLLKFRRRWKRRRANPSEQNPKPPGR